MPIFEFKCSKCGETFEQILSQDRSPECPKCGSYAAEKLISRFAVGKTSSVLQQASSGACGSCGDPRGPGACRLSDD